MRDLKFDPGTPIDLGWELAIYRCSWIKDNVLTVVLSFPRNLKTNELGVDVIVIDEEKYQEYEVDKWGVASREDVQKYMVHLLRGTSWENEIEDVLQKGKLNV